MIDEKTSPSYEELERRCQSLETERNRRLHGEQVLAVARQRVDEELTRTQAIQRFTGHALTIHATADLVPLFLECVVEAFECETALYMEYEPERRTLKLIGHFGEEVSPGTEYATTSYFPEPGKSALLQEGDELLHLWKDLNLTNALVGRFAIRGSDESGVIVAGTTTENANVFRLFDENHASSFGVLTSQVASLWNNRVLYDEIRQQTEQLQRQHEELEEAHSALERTNLSYSRFVPNDVLRFLGKESIVDVELGDSTEETMSVLFSDIRSFTSLSEKMSPEQTFRFLNDYLSEVGPVIREHGGFIDKYIGDAIMALFPGDADAAVHAAVAMRERLEGFNKAREARGLEAIEIGAGMHTGSLMLGTIGEAERMEGTVISDAVNLAARLEGLSKVFGARIVCSQKTLDGLSDVSNIAHRFIGKVKVKGKDEPVRVFDLFGGDPEEQRDLKMKSRETFESGMSLYMERNFTEASVLFNKVRTENPKDSAALLYLRSAAHLMIDGTRGDWDGTVEMTAK